MQISEQESRYLLCVCVRVSVAFPNLSNCVRRRAFDACNDSTLMCAAVLQQHITACSWSWLARPDTRQPPARTLEWSNYSLSDTLPAANGTSHFHFVYCNKLSSGIIICGKLVLTLRRFQFAIFFLPAKWLPAIAFSPFIAHCWLHPAAASPQPPLPSREPYRLRTFLSYTAIHHSARSLLEWNILSLSRRLQQNRVLICFIRHPFLCNALFHAAARLSPSLLPL